MSAQSGLLVLAFIALFCTWSARSESVADYATDAKNYIYEALEEPDVTKELGNIFMSYQILKNLNKESELKVTETECQALKKIKAMSLDIQSFYFYVALSKVMKTCQFSIENNYLIERYKQLTVNKSPILKVNYYTIKASSALQYKEIEIEEICKQIGEYQLPNGQGLFSLEDKKSSDYLNTGYILEIQKLCISQNKSASQITKDISQNIQRILENSIQISDNQNFFNEFDNSVLATIAITRNLYQIAKQLDNNLATAHFRTFMEKYFLNFLGFIQDNQDNLHTIDEKYSLIMFYQVISPLELVRISQNETVATKSVFKVEYEVVDAMGNPKKNVSSTFKFNLLHKNQVVLSNLPTKSSTQPGRFEIQISAQEIQNYGVYMLEITQTGEMNFHYERRIQLLTKVEVKKLQFTIMDRKGVPNQMKYSLSHKEILRNTQTILANNFIYVRFQLKFDLDKKTNIEQIGVQLISKRFKHITTFVQAVLQPDEYYLAEVDIGDPDVIQPFSDFYDLALIVSGTKIKENIFWVFSEFQVNFTTEGKLKPATDIDYTNKPPISFTFPTPPQDPPTCFIYFILSILLMAGLLYMSILRKLDLNTKRLPQSSFKKMIVWAFFALYIIAFLLLLYFWTSIRLVKLLKYIAILTVPFLFVANYALQFLKEQDKKK